MNIENKISDLYHQAAGLKAGIDVVVNEFNKLQKKKEHDDKTCKTCIYCAPPDKSFQNDEDTLVMSCLNEPTDDGVNYYTYEIGLCENHTEKSEEKYKKNCHTCLHIKPPNPEYNHYNERNSFASCGKKELKFNMVKEIFYLHNECQEYVNKQQVVEKTCEDCVHCRLPYRNGKDFDEFSVMSCGVFSDVGVSYNYGDYTTGNCKTFTEKTKLDSSPIMPKIEESEEREVTCKTCTNWMPPNPNGLAFSKESVMSCRTTTKTLYNYDTHTIDDCNDYIEKNVEKKVDSKKSSKKPLSWRALKGGFYWMVNDLGEVIVVRDERHVLDDRRYNLGNYYSTHKQAVAFIEAKKLA